MYIGNDAIHDLTKSGKAKLRIDLRKFSGEQGNVTYSTFKVSYLKVDAILQCVLRHIIFTAQLYLTFKRFRLVLIWKMQIQL